MDGSLLQWVSIHVLPIGQSSRELSRDDVFDILSNERRRYVLKYVEREEEDHIPLHELVDVVTAAEAAADGNGYDGSSSNVRSSVYSALIQTHLPAMDEAGIIEYDEDDQIVRTTDQTREVHRYMEYLPGHEIRWVDFYFGLAAVFAALVVVTWLAVPPFDTIEGIWLAAGIVSTFLVSTIAQMLDIR